MIMSEKMFVILGAFLFGHCFGYYFFEILKYKNNKDEIHQFFSSTMNNIVQAIDLITKKLQSIKEEIKIAKDNFLGNDLSFERKFLDDVTEMLGKELKD